MRSLIPVLPDSLSSKLDVIYDLSKVILEGVIVPSFEGRAIWIEPLTLVGVIFLDLWSYHILSGEDD